MSFKSATSAFIAAATLGIALSAPAYAEDNGYSGFHDSVGQSVESSVCVKPAAGEPFTAQLKIFVAPNVIDFNRSNPGKNDAIIKEVVKSTSALQQSQQGLLTYQEKIDRVKEKYGTALTAVLPEGVADKLWEEVKLARGAPGTFSEEYRLALKTLEPETAKLLDPDVENGEHLKVFNYIFLKYMDNVLAKIGDEQPNMSKATRLLLMAPYYESLENSTKMGAAGHVSEEAVSKLFDNFKQRMTANISKGHADFFPDALTRAMAGAKTEARTASGIQAVLPHVSREWTSLQAQKEKMNDNEISAAARKKYLALLNDVVAEVLPPEDIKALVDQAWRDVNTEFFNTGTTPITGKEADQLFEKIFTQHFNAVAEKVKEDKWVAIQFQNLEYAPKPGCAGPQ
jgi:hypothetical protein